MLGEVAERVSEVGAFNKHKQSKTLTGIRGHTQAALCRHSDSHTNTDAHTLLAHNYALIVINQGCVWKPLRAHTPVCKCVCRGGVYCFRLDSQKRRSPPRCSEGAEVKAKRGQIRGPQGLIERCNDRE